MSAAVIPGACPRCVRIPEPVAVNCGCQPPRLILPIPFNSPKTLYFQCRGRDSNPHGTFAPEDFKSFHYNEKVLVLLALFPTNVKVCKFLCKYWRKPNNIGYLQLCRSEGFSSLSNFPLLFDVFWRLSSRLSVMFRSERAANRGQYDRRTRRSGALSQRRRHRALCVGVAPRLRQRGRSGASRVYVVNAGLMLTHFARRSPT